MGIRHVIDLNFLWAKPKIVLRLPEATALVLKDLVRLSTTLQDYCTSLREMTGWRFEEDFPPKNPGVIFFSR